MMFTPKTAKPRGRRQPWERVLWLQNRYAITDSPNFPLETPPVRYIYFKRSIRRSVRLILSINTTHAQFQEGYLYADTRARRQAIYGQWGVGKVRKKQFKKKKLSYHGCLCQLDTSTSQS